MEQGIPWAELQALIEPHYPKGENGRPPVGLSIMLRVYFLQQWFNLSDPGAEEALYESPALRGFAGVDLGRAPAPDESTILQFRHLLEKHELGGAMLQTVNEYLESRGIGISRGTIVDASIIHAPSSTKNRSGERDPEMHQTRKGKQWCVSRTRVQIRGAVAKMGGGLPKPAYRSRLQTVQCCCVQKAMVQDDLHKMQTGGDSFAYLTFTPESANIAFGLAPPAPVPAFLVSITSHGQYPLRETHCTLMDDTRRNQVVAEYNQHPNGNVLAALTSADIPYYVPYLRPQSPEAPTGEVTMLGTYPFPSKDADDLTFSCASLNGYWTERIHLRKMNGQWHQSLSLLGPTVKQWSHPFIYFDPDYPDGKLLAEKDWQFQPQKRTRGTAK